MALQPITKRKLNKRRNSIWKYSNMSLDRCCWQICFRLIKLTPILLRSKKLQFCWDLRTRSTISILREYGSNKWMTLPWCWLNLWYLREFLQLKSRNFCLMDLSKDSVTTNLSMLREIWSGNCIWFWMVRQRSVMTERIKIGTKHPKTLLLLW